MSSRVDRRDSRLSWSSEAHQLYTDLLRWHAANAEALGRSPSWGREQAGRAWLAWYAALAEPCPGQRPDTMLGSYYADKNLLKRSRSMPEYGLRRYFGRIQRHYWGSGGQICEASVVCAGVSDLTKACKRAESQSLDQMLGHGRPAGFIISADVDGTVVRVRAMVSDATAMTKIDNNVYSGVVLEFDEEDRVHRVSLYDTDQLEKRGIQDVCPIFDREEARMSKGIGKATMGRLRAPSAFATPWFDAAWREWEMRYQAYQANPTLVTKAQCQRAEADVHKALVVESQRRPAGVGDAGLVNFLRHGRP
jgi:hypothetical protein